MHFSITTEVDAAPEVVFGVLTDVERLPAGLKRRSEERARGAQ